MSVDRMAESARKIECWRIYNPPIGVSSVVSRDVRCLSVDTSAHDEIDVVPAEQLRGAVEALRQIARVTDRGATDYRKLATITRLVYAALAAVGEE